MSVILSTDAVMLINKTHLKQMMEKTPRAQRIHDWFNGDFDALDKDQLQNIRYILQGALAEIDSFLKEKIEDIDKTERD